jgi:hypothetical protein
MTFEISAQQLEKYYRWKDTLPKVPEGHFGAAGGGYWFKFIPTGLGTILIAGREDVPELDIDLTDYQNF